MTRHYTWDDYFIPGTETLKNLLGSIDPDELRTREEDSVASRMLELQTSPVPGTFNLTHMCAIHRHLFQDVEVHPESTRTE
jgi:cell filamentation protein